MIIDFEIDCNMYKESILNFYGFWKYLCPCCGAKNSFTRHATYERNICTLESDTFFDQKLSILRLYCKSCDTTHAILPAGTIPYQYFSFLCVLTGLSEYFVREKSTLNIAMKHDISVQMVYLFIARFIAERVSCISFIQAYFSISLESTDSSKQILEFIMNKFTGIGFLKMYFSHTKQIFLMSRRHSLLSRTLWVGT